MSQTTVVLVIVIVAFTGAVAVLGWRLVRLHRLVDKVERRVEKLEGLQPKSDSDDSAAPDEAGGAEANGHAPPAAVERRPGVERSRSVHSKAEGLGPSQASSAAGAMAAFNALAAQFSQSELEAFVTRWQPELMARSAEDRLIDDPQGELWLLRTGVGSLGEQLGIIVPGPEVVRKWDLYYRAMGSLAAKNLLESIYEVGEEAPLRLEQPAVVVETPHGWTIERTGRFAEQ